VPPNNQPASPQPAAPGSNTVPPQVAPQPAPQQAPQQPAPAPAAATPIAKPQPGNQNSTQNALLVSEIRENMVIIKDGSFRAVIACQSINFDLMSSREREGVEFSYQNFLNSLYFPVQIFIRSQRVDIGPYIDRLTAIRRAQDNLLLNVLMDDYINFIDVLSQEANIMDKSFFIVVPYYPSGNLSGLKDQATGFFGKIFAKPQAQTVTIDSVTYQKAKDEVKNQVDVVISGLFQMGVKSVQLGTKELGELYYNVYNPDTAVREPLGNFENLTSTYVQKGEGNAPRPNLQGGV
jgi:hypothetical protein